MNIIVQNMRIGNFRNLPICFGEVLWFLHPLIFGEEDPMNYALLDFGMRSFATVVGFMIGYYGLEVEDEAQ